MPNIATGANTASIRLQDLSNPPANPPSTYLQLYARAGALRLRDSGGNETTLGGGGGAPDNASYIVEDASAGLSAEVLTTLLINRGAVSALPAAAKAARLYFPTDAPYLFRDTGAVQEAWGPLWRVSRVDDSPFIWVNQGGSTSDTLFGFPYMVAANGTAPNIRGRFKSAPAAPYRITALFAFATLGSIGFAGIMLREASTGRIISLHYTGGGVLTAARYTDPLTLSSNYATRGLTPGATMAGHLWLRIEDNNTNRLFQFSVDGLHWVTMHTALRTDFLTADQIGWGACPNGAGAGQETYTALLHWEEA